ncbi:MAG: hypothetical protein PHY45_17060 [Rhodocyclaceae bacterium]|nr:hypothetical protein [Rhodocyclaceae bacterium]
MSLSWRERVVVGLAPDQLSALALGGFWRPRLIDRHARLLAEQDAAHWDKGIAALEALLAEPAWRGRDITVVLSGHYVRHAVIPGGRGLADAARRSLADVVFREVFGDLARDWELRVSPTTGGMPTLACGVPRPLLAALQAACEGRGRLRSIQPSLMPVFNRARQQIAKSVGCLALVEPGRITVAALENGRWKYVDSRAGGGNLLPQLLLEEGELHARQPGGILWLCDLTGAARLPGGTFWSHKRIDPPRLAGFDGISSLAIWGVA